MEMLDCSHISVVSYLNNRAESSGFEWFTDGDVAIEGDKNCHPNCGRLRDKGERQQVDLDDLSLLHGAQSRVLEKVRDGVERKRHR